MQIISDISLIWFIPAIVLSFSLSYFLYYRDNKIIHIKLWLKTILIGLRFLSLLLIFLLLFGILIEKEEFFYQKPLLVFQVDDSQSMLNYKDSNEVKKINAKINSIKSHVGDKYDFITFPNHFNGKFENKVSNLSNHLALLNNQYSNRNIGAIIQITDGNFNQGISPEVYTEYLKFVPFYTIGIGDTIKKKDQFITDVKYNKIGFLGNEIPLFVELNQHGYDSTNFEFQLFVNGKLFERKKEVYKKNNSSKLDFLIPSKKVGLMHLKGVLKYKNNEFTKKNNSFDIYIEILDSKSKILFLTEIVTPDAMVFKEVFRKNKNIEMDVENTERFLEAKIENYDLFILNGLGKTKKGRFLLNKIAKKNKNLIYIVNNQSNLEVLNVLNTGIQFVGYNKQEKVNGKVNGNFNEFKIDEGFAQLMIESPPLSVKSGEYKTTGNALIVAFQSLRKLQKKSPLFVISKSLENKVFSILGEGIWRWRMYDYQINNSFDNFDNFIKKIIQYLKVNTKKSKLQIQNQKRINEDEVLDFTAEFYDESYEKINIPEIKLTIYSDDGLEQNYTFLKSSDYYQLKINGLEHGTYKWEASTNYNKKKYKKKGVVIVDEINIEKLKTNSNFRILNSIAKKTTGRFLNYKHIDSLNYLIENNNNIISTSYKENSYNDLINYIWFCFIICSLLFVEWFIRKYIGSY